MTDSSYDEDHHSPDDEHQHNSQHTQHTHSHSAFTQRFGAIKKQFPSAFKKNRFQPSFVNRIRSQSDINANMNGSSSHYSPHSHSQSQSSISPKSLQREHLQRGKNKKRRKKKKHHAHDDSPTDDHESSGSASAFAVVLNENRALKNEIEVYKRSLDAMSVEKDDLYSNYDELKGKVSDVTTQLRIMTKRYNKLKNKNEEYKKHFENTLSIRLSAQQQTIHNYHSQLTQIKEKYDILYAEYLDKNNIIKHWEDKYHRLANDLDQFMQEPNTKQLISEKDQQLTFLAQIISNMYHNALPIMQQISEEDEEHKTESSDSDSSHSIHEQDEQEHAQEEDELSGLEEEETRGIPPSKLRIASNNKSSDDIGRMTRMESKTPTMIRTSQSAPIKKKRRRSWVMEGGNGAIIITTIDGKHRVAKHKKISTQNTSNKSTKSDQNMKKKQEESPSKSIASASSSASSSSFTADVARSPAPPPPNPYVLQITNNNLKQNTNNDKEEEE
eukprot:193103_1